MTIEDGRYQSSVSQLSFNIPTLDSNSLLAATVYYADGDSDYVWFQHTQNGLFESQDPDTFNGSIQILSDPEMPSTFPASIAVIPEATLSRIIIDVELLKVGNVEVYP